MVKLTVLLRRAPSKGREPKLLLAPYCPAPRHIFNNYDSNYSNCLYLTEIINPFERVSLMACERVQLDLDGSRSGQPEIDPNC